MIISKSTIVAALIGVSALLSFPPTSLAQSNTTPSLSAEMSNAEVQKLAKDILRVGTLERNSVIARLVERGNTNVVPALM